MRVLIVDALANFAQRLRDMSGLMISEILSITLQPRASGMLQKSSQRNKHVRGGDDIDSVFVSLLMTAERPNGFSNPEI